MIDLCRSLEFASTQDVMTFLQDVRDYVNIETDEYGAHLVPLPSETSKPKSSKK